MMKTAVAAGVLASVSGLKIANVTKNVEHRNEVWTKQQELEAGLPVLHAAPHPGDHPVKAADLPAEFTWCNKDGVNYCTMSRNQHLPQYCGSCWAHGSLSALGDRIKIARGAKGIDINLAVQHMLNCGDVGSCYGGSVVGPYDWIYRLSKTGSGISYETSQSYMACSSDSKEGFCGHADWTCNTMNTARTCSTFTEKGGRCVGLTQYPNATVTSYGSVSGADAMAQEIYNRGPIPCGVDASYIDDYMGGIVTVSGDATNHVVSVVGWGQEGDSQYWIVRNSWGEYWGDMGYFYVEKGNNALQLETECAWAVPGTFTEQNFPCSEDGHNCL